MYSQKQWLKIAQTALNSSGITVLQITGNTLIISKDDFASYQEIINATIEGTQGNVKIRPIVNFKD
jgi:hypothetical protein